MNQYLGVDIEEIRRFKKLWIYKKHLLHWFYLPSELKEIEGANKPFEKMAGIWCAKEAVIKAFAPVIALRNFDIDLSGRKNEFPEAQVLHPDVCKINFSLSVSISHSRTHAVANALLIIKV